MQTTIANLQEEPFFVELVDSTRESIEKCKNDLVELHTIFIEFSVSVNNAIEEAKAK